MESTVTNSPDDAASRRRDEKQQAARRDVATADDKRVGYYADPMSPIASTPMKRPRTKPANTKSSKPKHEAVNGSTPAAGAGKASAEDESFFSPRKLMNEFGDGDKEQEEDEAGEGNGGRARKKARRVARSPSASPQSSTPSTPAAGADAEGVMFSPALKVPRLGRSPSSGSKTDPQTRLEAAFAATDSEQSDGHAELHDDQQQQMQTPDEDDAEAAVRCDESSLVSETESSSDAGIDLEFNPFMFIKSLPKYEELVPNGRVPALPVKTKHTPNICLVLDLDETLVHCTVDEVENPHLQFPVNFNGVDYTVNVKKRPHMEYFLKRVATQFEVIVFTASHRSYAEKLLNLIDPHRELIKYRLYRDDCLDVYGNYLKDLNVLGRHLSKVVLVDNSPHAFGYQVNNGIPIETWYDDEADDELLNLLPFLESLVDVDDVRPIVEKQFQIQKLIDSLPDEII
ncbi:hypothetical protein P43SY_008243 [Pythium insidiosum]|uniref:FCP1 homology domain-containing protein n=1 Tax=Pythium insidiosum TaxID=114742 RepID=A0AAD5QBB7_PYTIN|nr:hypothetical protein P43SY_008243 [Pythium insidiosum]